jgi:hypothetical protein
VSVLDRSFQDLVGFGLLSTDLNPCIYISTYRAKFCQITPGPLVEPLKLDGGGEK